MAAASGFLQNELSGATKAFEPGSDWGMAACSFQTSRYGNELYWKAFRCFPQLRGYGCARVMRRKLNVTGRPRQIRTNQERGPALQELIDRMTVRTPERSRRQETRMSGNGRLDSRINLAFTQSAVVRRSLFHSYSRAVRRADSEKNCARHRQATTVHTYVEGTLGLVEQTRQGDGRAHMSQWVFESTVASVALAAPDHILLDGYMQDVLFTIDRNG